METKKKFPFGLKLLFLLLFIMLSNMFSTCFAVEIYNVYDYNIPQEWFDECIAYYNSLPLPIDFSCSSSQLFDYYHNSVSGELINLWSGEGLNEMNMIVQFDYQVYSNGDKVSKLIFIQNNNTIGNVADNNCQLILNEASGIKVKAIVPTWSIDVTLKANGTNRIFVTTTKTSSGQTSTKTYNDLIFSYNSNVDSNTSTLIGMPLFGVNSGPLNVVSANINNVSNYWYFINNFYDINYQTPSDNPSGDSGENGGLGNITNTSGENNGNVNLQPIQDTLDDINNNIIDSSNNIISNQNNNTQTIVNALSGETQKITNTLTNSADFENKNIDSGDIIDSVDFSTLENNSNYSAFSNFWFHITTSLGNALTNSVRIIPVNWLGYNGSFNLDSVFPNYPTVLRSFLTIASTCGMLFLLAKWWKVIIDKITSGEVDEVLEMLEESGRITNYF